MKPIAIAALALAILAGAVGVTWWQRGKMKEQEFLQRLKDAPHKVDTVCTIRYIPQQPRDTTLLHLPAKPKDPAPIDSAFRQAYRGGEGPMQQTFAYVAAPIDTVVTFDSSGAVRVKYSPLTRALTIGLILPPRKEIDTRITDSVQVPIPDPDSWTTRATIFAGGAAVLGAVLALTR